MGSLVFAGAAALSTSVVALPATAQAGLLGGGGGLLGLGGGSTTYIVSAPSGTLGQVLTALNGLGVNVVTTLSFVNAVTAKLSSLEVTLLDAIPGIEVTPDLTVNVQGSIGPSGHAASDAFTQQSGATQLWAQGDTGAGVNVAVLDTGIAALPDFAGRMVDGVDLSGGGNPWVDSYGHGTFVAGLIAGNGASSNGAYSGEAPGAGLVSVKVAGATGQTDLATVIAGVGWSIANQSRDNISVLNMSLGYLPVESTVLDPLDQAVEKAWESGITVVASAGNSGPGNGTVLSPGDDPLVITTGAVDDGAQGDAASDSMTTFSSVGPTNPDGWFKPDLVTSGRSVVSLRVAGSTIDSQNPSARVGSANFVGSGTSFSSAITSGAAALLLAADPSYTPNTVKGTLIGTTAPGPVGDPFVDGHGILNVATAVGSAPMTLNQPVPNLLTLLGQTIGLVSSGAMSSWNDANWNGSAWNGSAWNGSAWNGSAWNGSAWNGSAWNGSTWNGSTWNGSAWNGSAWNGSAWNGSAWNGSAWNGSAWNGSAWNGSAWN
ncbi:MAG TPA: S8 family serine peptidase [Acidimicrobiales bacterium]|nr:S8 family serine peptidase [Acidimicrobiales bacterium]